MKLRAKRLTIKFASSAIENCVCLNLSSVHFIDYATKLLESFFFNALQTEKNSKMRKVFLFSCLILDTCNNEIRFAFVRVKLDFREVKSLSQRATIHNSIQKTGLVK